MNKKRARLQQFDTAVESGKTFDEAVECAGYNKVLDEATIEKFRQFNVVFNELNVMLANPERDVTSTLEKIRQMTTMMDNLPEVFMTDEEMKEEYEEMKEEFA